MDIKMFITKYRTSTKTKEFQNICDPLYAKPQAVYNNALNFVYKHKIHGTSTGFNTSDTTDFKIRYLLLYYLKNL
jgi:hypothetical protein